MKVVNYASYVTDAETVTRIRPVHRQYMDQLIAAGQLVAGGPFEDGSGALFIYEVPSVDHARQIVAADPYSTGGAFAHCELKEWHVVKARPDLLGTAPGASKVAAPSGGDDQ
jgi:uncharacterized protein